MDDNEVENKDLFYTCQYLVYNKDDYDDIEFEICNCWFHFECMKNTKSALNIIKRKELDLHWFCMTCDFQLTSGNNTELDKQSK